MGWSAPLLSMVVLVLLAAAGVGHGLIVPLLVLGIASMPVSLFAAFLARRGKTLDGTAVRVEGQRVVIEGGRAPIVFGPIAQGSLTSAGVWLEDAARRELTLDTAERRELLDALALEPAKRRFTFRWRRSLARIAAFWGGGIGLVTSAGLVFHALRDQPLAGAILCAALGVAPLLADVFSRWIADQSIEVGLDGLVARNLLGPEVFRFADVTDVKVEGDALVIRTADGRAHSYTGPPDADERAAIEQRIREAMDEARARAGHGSLLAGLLGRAGRTLPEWRAAVAKVLTAATGFRDGAVDEHALTIVLDDATATPEQRMAAAIALSEREALRPKIRVAAGLCASPKLRVALEALADGAVDDATLEGALAEADDARREARDPR